MTHSPLARFADFLAASLGWSYPANREADLLRSMRLVADELGYADADSCMNALLQSPLSTREIDVLAGRLTVGETYFLREPAAFAALEQQILPALIQSRRRAGNLSLRLWSAACCSGEEVYSLAILLCRLLPDLAAWRITLLGTDINPQALQRADAAIYTQWSFRNTPDWLVQGYFRSLGQGRFALLPRVRRLVRLAQHNLVGSHQPAVAEDLAGMDLILCRNVLMYFDRPRAKRAVQHLRRHMARDAWLLVGAAETDQQLFADFSPMNFPDCLFYRHTDAAPLTLPSCLPALAEPIPLAIDWAVPDEPVISALVPPDPPPPPSPYEQALLAYQQADYGQAETLLLQQTDSPAAILLLARLCAGQGRLVEAANWCEQAVAADRLNPSGQYLLALIHEELGHTDSAVLAVKRALYLEPRFVLAHVAMGNLARRLGQADAARHFGNALALLATHAPTDPIPESDGMSAGRLAEIIKAGVVKA